MNTAEDERLLVKAAKDGDIETVKKLISQKVNVNAMYYDETSALMFAAMNGHIEIVNLLIENNANVNARNNIGGTALIYAAAQGQEAVVKRLVDAKADVDLTDILGQTALLAGADSDKLAVVKILAPLTKNINACRKHTVYNSAGKEGHPVPEEVTDNTALLHAASNGNLEMVKCILEVEGVDVSAQGRPSNILEHQGRDALMHAVEWQDYDMVVALLGAGAKLDNVDVSGTTALMHAAEAKMLRPEESPETKGLITYDPRIEKLLSDRGASITKSWQSSIEKYREATTATGVPEDWRQVYLESVTSVPGFNSRL